MIRRLRAIAPAVVTSGAALALGATALAQAAKLDTVTTGEMHRFVIITFLTGSGTVLAGLAIVFSLVTRYRDSEMHAAISANTAAVQSNAEQISELVKMMENHHLDPYAHPIGSANRIDPINKKLDMLHEKLATLCAQHDLMQEQEGGICAALREARELIGRRDPNDSPRVQRSDDPPAFDGRPLRGRS